MIRRSASDWHSTSDLPLWKEVGNPICTLFNERNQWCVISHRSEPEPHRIPTGSRPLPDVQVQVDLGRGYVLIAQILPHYLQWNPFIKLPGGHKCALRHSRLRPKLFPLFGKSPRYTFGSFGLSRKWAIKKHHHKPWRKGMWWMWYESDQWELCHLDQHKDLHWVLLSR